MFMISHKGRKSLLWFVPALLVSLGTVACSSSLPTDEASGGSRLIPADSDQTIVVEEPDGFVNGADTDQTIVVEEPDKLVSEADTCRAIIVDDPDGFVNVRSSPQVQRDNLVHSLFNGTGIKVVGQRQGWLEISAPVSGWVAGNRTAVCCASHGGCDSDDIGKAIDTILVLGKRATRGELNAALGLVNMWTDGATAEAQAAALAEWAGDNPRFLFSVLEEQPQPLRQRTLNLIDYGFGPGFDEEVSEERRQFEAALEQLPSEHPVVEDWKGRPRLLW